MSGSPGGTLRVGIVGAGWMGQTHGQGWHNNAPRGVIAAVADVSEARAQELSSRHAGGKARLYPTLEAMLGDPNVDAVDICLPHHLHRDAIVAAAGAGKHVLCEKPLCLTFEEARDIRQAVETAGVTFMAAHNNLFAPGLLETRRRVEAGELGQRYFVRSTEAGRNVNFKTGKAPVALAPGDSSWSWRQDPAKAGGGEVLDTGWHGAYRLLALAGARPTQVSAMLGDFYINAPDVEDTGALLVRFENGALGFLLTSWAFGETPGSFGFQIAGERGTIGGTPTRIVVALHGEKPADVTFEPANTFAREVGHFLDVVQQGVPGLATWAHAARTLQLIRGAYRAAAEQRTVTLPEDPTAL